MEHGQWALQRLEDHLNTSRVGSGLQAQLLWGLFEGLPFNIGSTSPLQTGS
jgi:hypothetical protein